jgi:hypothetical protein
MMNLPGMRRCGRTAFFECDTFSQPTKTILLGRWGVNDILADSRQYAPHQTSLAAHDIDRTRRVSMAEYRHAERCSSIGAGFLARQLTPLIDPVAI